MRSLEPTLNFPYKSKLVRQHSGRHLRALGLGSDGAYRVKARRGRGWPREGETEAHGSGSLYQ